MTAPAARRRLRARRPHRRPPHRGRVRAGAARDPRRGPRRDLQPERGGRVHLGAPRRPRHRRRDRGRPGRGVRRRRGARARRTTSRSSRQLQGLQARRPGRCRGQLKSSENVRYSSWIGVLRGPYALPSGPLPPENLASRAVSRRAVRTARRGQGAGLQRQPARPATWRASSIRTTRASARPPRARPSINVDTTAIRGASTTRQHRGGRHAARHPDAGRGLQHRTTTPTTATAPAAPPAPATPRSTTPAATSTWSRRA